MAGGGGACMGQSNSVSMLPQMDVGAENLRSSPPPLTANYPATEVHVPNHESEASTSEGENATTPIDVGGTRAGSSTENLTGAAPVASEHQLDSLNSSHVDEATHSLVTPVAGPVGNLGEEGTQPTQRRASVQLSLTSFSQPPIQPELPNLALAALQRLAENDPDKDDSVDDFRPLKKRKLAPEAEKTSEDGEEGQTCSICFEPWSNSGGHRIASLKCGHLFGLNCIEKWLKGQGGGKCPQCNAKAKKADIRVIFAKTISVVDTTERDRAIQERDEEKAQRITAQKAEAQAILQYQLKRAECERLKDQLKDVTQQLEAYLSQGVKPSKSGENLSSGQASGSRDDNASYVPYKTLSVAPDGGARVIAHDPNLGMLVVSKPICNQLLPGYGLVKYSSLELGRGEYVAVHSGVIRDAVFSPQGNGLVLTAGMDKTCRLTSMHSNLNVVTYKTPSPVWACAWNLDHPNYMYAGLNGSICVYDVRNTAECVSHLRTEGVQVPITSLSYVPLCQFSTLNVGGLLAGTLNGGVFWERDNHEETFTPHPLTTIPGNCTCLSFEPITRHCMASFRPSKRSFGSPHSTHVLCQLSNVPRDKPFSCRPIHQFTGGTSHRLLSRSRLFQRPGNDGRILAAFGNEEEKSVHIWNASSMKKLQTLQSLQGSALDITPFSCNEKEFLAVLSETTLSVFHWQQQSITV